MTLSVVLPGRATRLIARAGALVTVSAGLALINLGPAEAHVEVHADNTAAGSFSELTFQVPNESATAGTVKLTVRLPQNPPFLAVSTKPVAGWTTTTTEARLPKPAELEGTTITKAVRTVAWTAKKGNEIKPGQYQEFSISVGPLPPPATILLPAEQTYSNGTVVRWDQRTPASGKEPENPVPVLEVTAVATGNASPTPAGTASTAAGTANRTSDSTARTLAGVALAVAAAGLVVAIVDLRRRAGTRRSA
jgi:uncharacterized protein YcnI